ncbi:MAG: hypothetical protein A2W31_15775 [Planctomycetes bacterium RBG_16_64_10]|nr:MAG: hypothetical protein A2W31_15775 [Planctomycetes bacterium RBG_16_64_10]
MNDGHVQVSVVPPEGRMRALRVLFPASGIDERTELVAELLAASEHHGLAGLLEARRDGQLVGAVWAQTQPGLTAVLWPPGLAHGEGQATARRLLTAACRHLAQQRIVIAQSLLGHASEHQAAGLQSVGFAPTAELIYLLATESSFPGTPPARDLEFESHCQANRARLAGILLRTYEQSLDCPQLNGVRRVDDILAGYRATGSFDPAHWLIVRRAGRDIGCLLLADQPRMGHVELMYMGVVPEARGSGCGLAMVRHAQWLARTHGRARLMLAVDARNRPALAIYDAAGFVGWERRQVWTRTFAGS